MKVIIVGGGVMGTCLAHFLAEGGAESVKLIERHKVACAASGKAGGFLARDWCRDDPAANQLATMSFDLHKELASNLNGKDNYDYRPLKAFSVHLRRDGKSAKPSSIPWLDGSAVDDNYVHAIGTTASVAQLHPYKFVHTLIECSKRKGVEVLEDHEVADVLYDFEKTKVIGVRLNTGQTLDCNVVAITMGPWSGTADKWFCEMPSIHGQKAHSITVKPSQSVPGEAVFVEFDNDNQLSPELYPRPDGEVYICGMAENPLKSHSIPPSNTILPTTGSCERIKEMSNMVSSYVKDGQTVCSQACYMPLTQDGRPMIGKLNGVAGLYMAAGHGCWGILNSPATGKLLADLILEKSLAIDLKAFDPNRFCESNAQK